MPKILKATGRERLTSPWWLDDDGSEECPHCGQIYVYEVEFRCGACDSPSCPCCAMFDQLDVCRECAAASEER